ncbi:hypothetical protein UlMin_019827 [Ulmus minor]
MIVFAWNYKGLRQPSVIRDLKALLRSSSPDCLILMETKASYVTMQRILVQLHFPRFVDCSKALDNLGMLSIPSSSFYFTSSNNRHGRNRINSCIDRGVANENWWGLFPNASIKLLPQSTSDHNPQVLYCFGQHTFAKRPFIFEAAWVEDQRSYWVINQAWFTNSHLRPPTKLLNKIQTSRVALGLWNKCQFGNIQTNIKSIRDELAILQRYPNDPIAVDRDRNLRHHLNHLLKLEEVLWFQKSRLKWQLKGDKCTRFFFLTTLARRKSNRIDCIKDDFGSWLSSRNQIGQAFL